MPEIQGLDAEDLNRIVGALGQPEAPLALESDQAEMEDLSSLLTDMRDLNPKEQRELISYGERLVAEGNNDEASRYFQRVLTDAPRGSAEAVDAGRLYGEISLRRRAASQAEAPTAAALQAAPEAPAEEAEAVVPVAPEAEAPAVAGPAVMPEAPALIDDIPDWLRSPSGGDGPQAGEPVAENELPEWLRPPAAPLAPEAPQPSFPAETEEERLARLDQQVLIGSIDRDGDLLMMISGQNFSFGSPDRSLELLIKFRGLSLYERGNEKLTDENLDHAIAKLEAMKAAKEAAAGTEAEAGGLTEEETAEIWERHFAGTDNISADRLREIIALEEKGVAESEGKFTHFSCAFDKRAFMPVDEYLLRLKQILAKKETEAAKGAEPLVTMPVSFAVRVEVARGMVVKAAEEAGLLPEKIAGDLKVAGEMRITDRETGLRIEEIPEEELREARGTLVKLRAPDSYLNFLDDSIALQKQYRLGAETAAAVEESMRAATKELKPGWFEKEPAVVKEMAELQKFFDRTGNAEELRRTITEIEDEKKGRAWKNGGMTAEYKKKEEAELTRANADLATLGSADRFMARTDMPKILRAVIDAARAGRPFDFGTGPVANFRREVYESIIGTLGIEAMPAAEPTVEVVEAAAPAAAAVPETKPAAVPVETVEQIRQKAEKEFLGEDKLDPAVSKAQKNLRESAVNGRAHPKAVAEALAKQAEQNPGARRAVVAGAKQLVVDVLTEARRERDSKKRQKMLTWVKDFGVGFEATAMAGELGLGTLDALISAIVNELGGQK